MADKIQILPFEELLKLFSLKQIKTIFDEWKLWHSQYKVTNKDEYEIGHYIGNPFMKENFFECISDVGDIGEEFGLIINGKLAMLISESKYDMMGDFIFSPEYDWYMLFDCYINFFREKTDILRISFQLMEHHPFIHNMVNLMIGVKFLWRNEHIGIHSCHRYFYEEQCTMYDISLKKYKIKKQIDDNQMAINIIGYTEYDKKKELFNHKTNFNLIKTIEKDLAFDHHIIFEKPFLLFNNLKEYPSGICDIYLDLSITYKNMSFILDDNDTLKNRLNKLVKIENEYYYSYGCRMIYGLSLSTKPNASFSTNIKLLNFISNECKLSFHKYKKKLSDLRIDNKFNIKNKTLIPDNFISIGLVELFSEKQITKKILKVKSTNIGDNNNCFNYIYMLWIREFKNANKPIYKIGKTKQHPSDRINQYPKDSEIVLITKVFDCDNMERELIKLFSDKFIRKLEYGNEYFEGDEKEMVRTINRHLKLI